MKTVLTEVAEQFHVSPEEVRAEIARAIHLALTSGGKAQMGQAPAAETAG